MRNTEKRYYGELEIDIAFAAVRRLSTMVCDSILEVKDLAQELLERTVQESYPCEGMVVTANLTIETENGEYVESDEATFVCHNGKLVMEDMAEPEVVDVEKAIEAVPIGAVLKLGAEYGVAELVNYALHRYDACSPEKKQTEKEAFERSCRMAFGDSIAVSRLDIAKTVISHDGSPKWDSDEWIDILANYIYNLPRWHYSVPLEKQHQVIEFLLENGEYGRHNGEYNLLRDNCGRGQDIIRSIAIQKRLDILQILYSHGYILSPESLVLALDEKFYGMVKMLCEEYGVSADTTETYLVGRGASCVRDRWKYSPLLRAVDTHGADADVIKLLLEHGASVNEDGNNGSGLINCALYNRDEPKAYEIVQVLVDAGARVSDENILTAKRRFGTEFTKKLEELRKASKTAPTDEGESN